MFSSLNILRHIAYTKMGNIASLLAFQRETIAGE